MSENQHQNRPSNSRYATGIFARDGQQVLFLRESDRGLIFDDFDHASTCGWSDHKTALQWWRNLRHAAPSEAERLADEYEVAYVPTAKLPDTVDKETPFRTTECAIAMYPYDDMVSTRELLPANYTDRDVNERTARGMIVVTGCPTDEYLIDVARLLNGKSFVDHEPGGSRVFRYDEAMAAPDRSLHASIDR